MTIKYPTSGQPPKKTPEAAVIAARTQYAAHITERQRQGFARAKRGFLADLATANGLSKRYMLAIVTMEARGRV